MAALIRRRDAKPKAVVGSRLTLVTLFGRDTPGLRPGPLFAEMELAVTEDFAAFRSFPWLANL